MGPLKRRPRNPRIDGPRCQSQTPANSLDWASDSFEALIHSGLERFGTSCRKASGAAADLVQLFDVGLQRDQPVVVHPLQAG